MRQGTFSIPTVGADHRYGRRFYRRSGGYGGGRGYDHGGGYGRGHGGGW